MNLIGIQASKQSLFIKRVFIVHNNAIKETCSKSLSLFKRICITEFHENIWGRWGDNQLLHDTCTTAPFYASSQSTPPLHVKLQCAPQWAVIKKRWLVEKQEKEYWLLSTFAIGHSPHELQSQTTGAIDTLTHTTFSDADHKGDTFFGMQSNKAAKVPIRDSLGNQHPLCRQGLYRSCDFSQVQDS